MAILRQLAQLLGAGLAVAILRQLAGLAQLLGAVLCLAVLCLNMVASSSSAPGSPATWWAARWPSSTRGSPSRWWWRS